MSIPLTCRRCHHDVWLLIDGICRDCIIAIEDERAIAADAIEQGPGRDSSVGRAPTEVGGRGFGSRSRPGPDTDTPHAGHQDRAGVGGEAVSYLPPFLRERDPDREHDMRWARDAYALRGSEDRAMRLNYGYGTQPFTVEDALAWAERRAEAILGSGRRWTQ